MTNNFLNNINKLLLTVILLAFLQIDVKAQANNAGQIYISGNAYLAASFTNSAGASYINNGNYYLTGDFINNQTSAMVPGSGTTTFTGSSLQKITGSVSCYFYNATVNNTANVEMDKDQFVLGIFKPQSGALQINSNTLNLSGTIDNTVSNTGTISGDAGAGTSNLNITGTGTLGIMNFTPGAQVLQNFTLNKTSGNATLGTNLSIGGITATTNNGIANLVSGNALLLNGHTLGLNGTIAGTGTLSADAASGGSSALTIGGNLNTSAGTLYFTSGAQTLNAVTINRINTTIGRAILGSDLAASNITLTYGVIATASNLFTWNHTGTLSQPQPTFATNDASYTHSFIATCDVSGTPVTNASATTAYTGAVGFRIQNVDGSGSTDTYFPVAASFNPAAASAVATPNRMMLNSNYGTNEDFTVALDYGDIGNTPGPRINRVWYVKVNNARDTGYANMKLFYTNRGFSGWPSTENEVEIGFVPSASAIVQKDYSGNPNFINISGTKDNGNVGSQSNTSEGYAQYTISAFGPNGPNPPYFYSGLSKGITTFNRFSIVNPGGIVLPVTIINFKAYQQGAGVENVWTCVNEKNMDHYEIQHSINGSDFSGIGSDAALNNGQTSLNYTFYDAHPANGYNFYRIKAVGKDGTISYTNTNLVNIGGAKPGVAIFPNPVTSMNFNLQMTNMPGGKYALLIYNMLGQVILSQQIERQDGSSSKTVYLPAGTARGIYKVTIINGSSRIIKTITVQ